jgi:2-haloacid dehalogenase/putative hydrolase of the HAD superfamily
MELDGVFIDMYGTLTTGDRAAVEAVCAQIVAHARLPLSAYELSITWGERFFAAMEQANGERFETLSALEARTLQETMTALGTTVDPWPYVTRLVDYWRNPPLQADAFEFLTGCRTPLCIVSNADRADIEAALARHGLRVAGLMTSQDARSYKPDPGLFEAALRLTGWRRERVLHVGDSLHSDVGGAQRAGLISGWVNRAHRIHDIGNHEPDYEFADLHELRRLADGR